MNLITKRFVATNLEKTLYDAFVTERRSLNKSNKLHNPQNVLIETNKNNKGKNDYQNARTITDKWLLDALNSKVKSEGPQVISLQLPIILKTLQKLRTTNNVNLYFKLLTKLNSTKVNWVVTAHPTSVEKEFEQKTPIEFYHELSNMLMKISSRTMSFKDEEQINALAKFSLNITSQYVNLIEKTNGKIYLKFWNNVISIVLKTKSAVLLEEMLKLIQKLNQNESNIASTIVLTDFAYVLFYLETDQLLKLEEYIKHSKSLNPSNILTKVDESSLDMLCPLLLKTLDRYVNAGIDDSYDQLANIIARNYSKGFDEHDIASLDILCNNEAIKPFSEYLGRPSSFPSKNDIAFENLKRSIIVEDKSILDVLKKLQTNNIDPYNEHIRDLLDFVIFKFDGTNRPDLEIWKDQFSTIVEYFSDNQTPLSIQKFFVNTLMKHFVGDRYFGFALSILKLLYIDSNFKLSLVECQDSIAVSSTGFHPLFKSITNSKSSILSSLKLLELMSELEKRNRFQFIPEDFNYLFVTALQFKDRVLFNFYLREYIIRYGHETYNKDKKKWSLPPQLSWIASRKIRFNIHENVANAVQSIYINNNGSPMNSAEVEELTKCISNGNKYPDRIDISYDDMRDILRNKLQTNKLIGGGYSLLTDHRYSTILEDVIKHMELKEDEITPEME